MNNILVIAAHPDDEVLGVGGTVRKLVNTGKTVRAVVLGEGLAARGEVQMSELLSLQNDARKSANVLGYESIDFCSLPDNSFDSLPLLDVIKLVSGFVDKYKPDTVFTHFENDLNIDHRITSNAVMTACRPVGNYTTKRLYAFETLSSTEWRWGSNINKFNPNMYVNIDETIEQKLKAMECYTSEIAEYPHPRSSESIKTLAMNRGTNVGVCYAEAFVTLFEII